MASVTERAPEPAVTGPAPIGPALISIERFALVGVSHRRGGAAALEAWGTCNPDALLAPLGVREWALLATCNRWELALALPPGVSAAHARAALAAAGPPFSLYGYAGEGALEHLARVAASLESLNPGEDQILGQVRAALLAAQQARRAGPLLSFAFDTALKVGKKTRRDIRLAPLHTSLFSLALPDLQRALRPGDTVAVLGAGQMGELAARTLRSLGVRLLVVNRSPERGARLAATIGAAFLPLDTFLGTPPSVRAVVTALPVGGLLDAATLGTLPDLALIVDLGVPRNVGSAPAGVRVLDVDTLQVAGQARRAALQGRLAEAERLVRSELDAALDAWTERQLGPSIRRLTAQYRATLGESLPEEAAARLAQRFAHVPVKGLRAIARTYGLEAARTFLAETGLSE